MDFMAFTKISLRAFLQHSYHNLEKRSCLKDTAFPTLRVIVNQGRILPTGSACKGLVVVDGIRGWAKTTDIWDILSAQSRLGPGLLPGAVSA